MRSDFSRILTNLRKEKNISQRSAAEALEISQALLSHYEKGMREPGLAFVVRVADFYNVSCDYILGKSVSKESGLIKPDEIFDTTEDKDNVMTGSVAAMLQKKLIINSISVLFDIVGKTRNKELVSELAAYLYIPIYKVYRYLVEGKENSTEFKTPKAYFDPLCDAEMRVCEAKIKAVSSNDSLYCVIENEVDFSEITPEYITKTYPKYATSLFNIVQNVSDTISITTNPHTKTKPKKTKKK